MLENKTNILSKRIIFCSVAIFTFWWDARLDEQAALVSMLEENKSSSASEIHLTDPRVSHNPAHPELAAVGLASRFAVSKPQWGSVT